MLLPSVLSRLMLAILWLALSKNIQSAPTHHLTIGVQGNTPTLMVTSSEIGITAQTMGVSYKKPKIIKEPVTPKKTAKTKLNKNSSLNNKKDKLQYLTKPPQKQDSKEINSLKLKKTGEHKNTKTKTFVNSNTEMITTTAAIKVSSLTKNSQIYERNSQSTTTLSSQLMNETPIVSSTTTANSVEELSTLLPPATTDTTSIHFAATDNDDLNISPVATTTLSPKDFATTLNNNDDTNTDATLMQTQPAAVANSPASPTHRIPEQISTQATGITDTANEDDSDRYRYTPESTTDNENLLLTTIETNAFTTPTATAEISTPSTVTLETNNTETTTTKDVLALSLITTATRTQNAGDDNNNGNSQEEAEEQQQQQPTATKKSHKNSNESNKSTTRLIVEAKNHDREAAANPIKHNYQNDSVLINSEKVYTSTTLAPLQHADESRSTENPVKKANKQSTPETNNTTSAYSQNNVDTVAYGVIEEAGPGKQQLAATGNEQPVLHSQFHDTSTTTTETPESTSSSVAATTETILKLIDLEKHIPRTIDELKQPSVLTAQHDNGHDGLKATKKKQLIDKHYVEALLHQKQDVHRKDSKDYSAATNSSQAASKSHIPLQHQHVEHGSLGPILMQEKTFHVTHHNEDATQIKSKHLKEDINIQLKRGHFVELKAQPVANKNKEKKKEVANKRQEEEDRNEMQSDQPQEDIETKEPQQNRDEKKFEETTLVSDKSNSSKTEARNMSEQKKTKKVSQPTSATAKGTKTSENTNLELKLMEEQNHSETTAKKDGPNYQSTDKKLHPAAFEEPQQLVAKNLSVKTSDEGDSKRIQGKSPNQLVNSFKVDETSDENEQQEKPKILVKTNQNLGKPKMAKEIEKSDIVKEASTLKLKQTFSEQKPQDDGRDVLKEPIKQTFNVSNDELQEENPKPAAVLSSTVFQVIDSTATKTPTMQAETLFTAQAKKKPQSPSPAEQKIESKISDIQIEVYDSTVDSIVASTNFKDNAAKQQHNHENYLGKTTKPPVAAIQQERFTQYVIDRTETSTHEPINYNTIKVAAGKPEPAAIEIHINVSESFGNESEDLEFSYPQTEFVSNQQNEKAGEESYDENKVSDSIKLKIPSNLNSNNNNLKDTRNDEILVVEIIDTESNNSDTSPASKTKMRDELFITDVKHVYTTPPPPPPPPPYQTNFDRDSDTIFYISNTEVKVGESLPAAKNTNEERKLKLESQFFPANYMASTHPSLNNNEDANPHPNHHLYEEDIILSPNRNQADALKIYRNNNEPSPPLDVTYVGESIIEVEQSPDAVATTTYAPDQVHIVATPQPDIIIQPAILPEISIGVPVIGELPPQIELKEIDFMPNEAQLRRSGIYDDNDNSNNIDLDENTITGSSSSSSSNGISNNNSHDVDIVGGNSNSNQHIDESSIQYGGDLIDESADGGFDGVEGSYPFGNPALVKKSYFSSPSFSSSLSSPSSYSAAFLTKLQKQQQQPNHVADYAHLYVNYGVNNMRKDELTADVKDSGEVFLNGNVGNGNNANVASNEQNTTSFKEFLSKVGMSNATMAFASPNATQSERMSNATAFSVMEDANDLEDKSTGKYP